jgi:hypothetical protein
MENQYCGRCHHQTKIIAFNPSVRQMCCWNCGWPLFGASPRAYWSEFPIEQPINCFNEDRPLWLREQRSQERWGEATKGDPKHN